MYPTKKSAISRLFIIFLIIVVLNVLFSMLYFRLDFTADKRYTLSKTTKNVLKLLDQQITVTAYFSSKLPPDILYLKNDFRDMLIEYANYSKKKVVFNFVDPSKDPRVLQKAKQKGIQPVIVNIRKKDKFQQQEVYLGAIVQMGEKSEVIPAIQPGAPMEYALTFSIKKCATKEKNLVGLVTGQNEASISELSYLSQMLSDLYEFEEVPLTDTALIPPKFKTLAIINPKDSFSEKQLIELELFLGAGGNLLICYSYADGNLSEMPPVTYLTPTGLENFLAKFGVQLLPNLVYDLQSSQITVQQKQGDYVINTPLDFYYIPFITNFADHPITKGLESILLPFASEIRIINESLKIKITALASSSKSSGTEAVPSTINLMKQWTDNDFNRSAIPVAVAVEGSIRGSRKSKLVVVSNGNFALNDQQGRMQGTPDNMNFIAGAIDWLSDKTGLSDLRTKSVVSRPIKQMSDDKKNLIKYLNFFLPILLTIIIGIIRYRRQQSLRKQWMKS